MTRSINGSYPRYVHERGFEPWSIGVLQSLTKKEREVMNLVVAGWSNKQIGRQLRYSIYTIKERISGCNIKLAPFASSVGVCEITSRTGKAVVYGYAKPLPIENYDRWCRSVRETLTKSQIPVLQRVACGITNGQVAMDLGLSEYTVKTHLQHMTKALCPLAEQIGLSTPADRTMLSIMGAYAGILAPPRW